MRRGQPRPTLRGLRVRIGGASRVFLRDQPLAAAGGLLVLLLVGVALAAPRLAPFDPYELHVDRKFAAPSREMLLGGDQLGRDVLSRLLFGARISLYVGLTSVGIGVSLGALVGVLSAYAGGLTDLVVQRLVDALMPFPPIVLGLAMMGVLGSSIHNVVLALVIVLMPGAARTLRAQTLGVVGQEYVQASIALGGGTWRLIGHHILPNVMGTYIVLATMTIGHAIVAEASLSFLGVGVPPDVPSWGAMTTAATLEHAARGPWLAVYPGLAISLVVFGFNLLGDGLRDVLDPRLRG